MVDPVPAASAVCKDPGLFITVDVNVPSYIFGETTLNPYIVTFFFVIACGVNPVATVKE